MRKEHRYLVGGLLIGAMLVAGIGTSSGAFSSRSVEDINFPRRQSGITIVGDSTTLATTSTRLEDLPRLVERGETDTRRFEVIPFGTSNEEFLLLDTRSGLVRRYTGNSVTIYSATVPNHTIRAPIQRHSAF